MNIDKKIVLLSSSLAGGGAEGVCVNIANSLALRGWQVDLLVLNLNKAVYAANEIVQITIKIDTSKNFLDCSKVKVALIQEFDLKYKNKLHDGYTEQKKQNLFLLSVYGPNAGQSDWVHNCYVDLSKLTETSYG